MQIKKQNTASVIINNFYIFHQQLVLLVLILYMKESTQYVALCLFLLSLSIVAGKFIDYSRSMEVSNTHLHQHLVLSVFLILAIGGSLDISQWFKFAFY